MIYQLYSARSLNLAKNSGFRARSTPRPGYPKVVVPQTPPASPQPADEFVGPAKNPTPEIQYLIPPGPTKQ